MEVKSVSNKMIGLDCEDANRLYRALQERARTGVPITIEFNIYDKDGEVKSIVEMNIDGGQVVDSQTLQEILDDEDSE